MAERDLTTLIRTMTPELRGVYVFCAVDEPTFASLPIRPLGFFQEEEGLTIILPRDEAERHGLDYTFTAALITLKVHSDLAAVGFLAAISRVLAQEGISTNVVSAYYHDHLFVPYETAERALALLQQLSQGTGPEPPTSA